MKKTKMFAGDPAPFVMELPAYHMPTVGNVLRSMWERGWFFIKKAGTIILLSTIVLWFLMSFGWVDKSFGILEKKQLDSSILASLGNVLAPIFRPLEWGDWKMTVAAVTGLNNVKWFWFAIGYQTVLVYVVSLCIFQIGNLFIGGTFAVGTAVAIVFLIGFIYLLI